MADIPLIDAKHPWPWLDAFPEYAEPFFNGRDEDSEALLRCVLAVPVTVLFGKSGLGKSSLLQAGLFPRLRQERLLPVYVRLEHDQNASSASEQIAKRFHEQLKPSFPAVYAQLTDSVTNDSLWAQLHRIDTELRDAEGRRWTPVFVLDQFEEIFTRGAADVERQKQLFYELGDLMENRIPKTLAERLHTDDELYDQLNLDAQHYRFLLSLREDYLPDLEEWADLIPRLGPNRYRLLPLSYTQAIAAIEKTGGALVTHDNAVHIVNYLSEKQAEQQFSTQRQRNKARIEPALLSLICSSLNEKRLQANQPRLTTDNLSKEGSHIVEGFYDAAFSGLPESARDFVEQHLITADGVRLSYPERSVETARLATGDQLQTLIKKRLIRRENLEGSDRLELVHDRLAQVALQRRLASQQRKEDLRQQQIRHRWVVGIIAIIILLIGFAAFMFDAKTKAQRAWLDATALRLAAEGSAMAAGTRSGGTVKGLFKVLAGHRLARSANTDEVLLAVNVKFDQLIFIRENSAAITSVAFSPDGTRIVSGSADGMLRLWDAASGQPIGAPLTGHEHGPLSVAFNPDGTRIVSGSFDTTLRLWDAATGQPIGEPLTGHTGEVASVAFSPDGTRIVSGSHDNTLRLWDTNSGRQIGKPLKGHDTWVRSVAFSPDGTRIISGSFDNTLRLWDANSGKQIGEPLTGHAHYVSSVAFSPDGTRIVSGSHDNTLRLWDVNSGKQISEPLTGHVSWVWSVAFSPDGTRIVSGSTDGTLRLWDANSGKQIGQPHTGMFEVLGVAFSPNGTHIVSGSGGGDNTLRLWDASSGKQIGEPLTGHEHYVSSVAFSPDGTRIVSGSHDNTLRLWDANSGKQIGEPLTGHEYWVSSVAFSPDGTRIVSGSNDGTLRLWDANSGKQIGQPLTSTSQILSVAFSPDGTRIVSGSTDGTLRLWDANSGKQIGEPLTGHKLWVWSVAFSPDSTRIVSGGNDGTLRLWDANSGKQIGQPLIDHANAVFSVAFSPDGRLIASGSKDGRLILWDADRGKQVDETWLQNLNHWIPSVAFSPDGTRIVSGSTDGMLRLWDTASRHPIGSPLAGHEHWVLSVAFSPDGTRIVSGSQDKTLRLWRAFESRAETLCDKLDRNMSQQEWQEWVSPEIEYQQQCPGLPIPADEPEKAD